MGYCYGYCYKPRHVPLWLSRTRSFDGWVLNGKLALAGEDAAVLNERLEEAVLLVELARLV